MEKVRLVDGKLVAAPEVRLEKCIDLIQDGGLREKVQKVVDSFPEYFWEVPASATGKYHPEYALGKGGLARHTRAAVWFATQLFGIVGFSQEEMDRIIAALIIHDGWKHGETGAGHTVDNHAALAASRIDDPDVARLVASHMGRWNIDRRTGEEVAPKPVMQDEKFVHMCDYLASRRGLSIDFDYIRC